MAEDLELVSLFRGSIGKVLNFLLTCEEENSKSDIARGADVTFKTVSDIWPFLERHEIIVHTRTIGMAKMYSLNKDNRIVGQLRKIKHEINNHNHNNKGLGEIFSVYGFLLLLTLPLLGTVYFTSNESTIDVSNWSLINITTLISNETNASNITEILVNGTIESIILPVEGNASESAVVEINSDEALLNITAPEPANITEEPMPVIETTVEEIAYRHEPIEIGQRVQWYRQIKAHGGDNYTVGLNLPPDYSDLAMVDSLGNYTLENGTLLLSGEHDIQMSFTTSPVEKIEEELSTDPYSKKVTVTSQSDLHYSNITVSTSIPEGLNITMIEMPGKEITQDPGYNVSFIDTDGNGISDTLSWIVPQLSTKEYLIQEAAGVGKITFDRTLDCQKCGQHKAPPLADVTMTISATFSGTLTNTYLVDYFPVEWFVTNPNGGTVEGYNSSHSKISWHYDSVTDSVSQWYVVYSPQRTLPPTNYYFISELAGKQSEPWRVIVADPAEEIFYDDFESGTMANWWVGSIGGTCSNNWVAATTQPLNLTYSAYVVNVDCRNAMNRTQNLTGYYQSNGRLNVSFSVQTAGLDAEEMFNFSYWNGSVWNLTLSLNAVNILYANYSYNLGIGSNRSDFKMSFICYSGQVNEYCDVDNVRIIGTSLVSPSLLNVTIGNVTNTYRGDTDDDIYCNATSSGGSTLANVTLQFQNATGWYTLNQSFNGGKVAYVADYTTNPRWEQTITTTGTIVRFSVYGNWTGSQSFRCNVTQGALGSAVRNISSTASMNVLAPPLNATIESDLSPPITIYNDDSNDLNLTCNVQTLIGNASSVSLYAQWNSSSAPGTWNNFSETSGSLMANESSPILFTNVDNSTNQTRVFRINGTTAGNYSVRCYANSSSNDGSNDSATNIIAVNVAIAPVISLKNVTIGNVSNIYRGDRDFDIFCNATSEGGTVQANVSLQYNNGTIGSWINLNETNWGTSVSYNKTEGTNPRWNQAITTTSTIFKFGVFANWTGSPQFRCNVSQGPISNPVKVNLSSTSSMNIMPPPLNTTMNTDLTPPISLGSGASNNFNMTCNVSALIGNASSVTLYPQWNSTVGVWNPLNGTSGPMLSNESGLIVFSNVDNSSRVNKNRTFQITGSTAGSYSVRCYSNSSDKDGSYTNSSGIAAVNVVTVAMLFNTTDTNDIADTSFNAGQIVRMKINVTSLPGVRRLDEVNLTLADPTGVVRISNDTAFKFYDNFSDASYWSPVNNLGAWNAVGNWYNYSNSTAYFAISLENETGGTANKTYLNLTIEAKVNLTASYEDTVRLIFRYNDSNNYSALFMTKYYGAFGIEEWTSGVRERTDILETLYLNQIYDLKVVVNGSTAIGYLDGEPLVTRTLTRNSPGRVGVGADACSAFWTNYTVTSQYATALQHDNMVSISYDYKIPVGAASVGVWNASVYAKLYTLSDNASSTANFTVANTNPSIDSLDFYLGTVKKDSFVIGSSMIVESNVTDPQGVGLANVTLTLVAANTTYALINATMVNVTAITNGYSYRYTYVIPIPLSNIGLWSVTVRANDTTGNFVTSSRSVKVIYGWSVNMTLINSTYFYNTDQLNNVTYSKSIAIGYVDNTSTKKIVMFGRSHNGTGVNNAMLRIYNVTGTSMFNLEKEWYWNTTNHTFGYSAVIYDVNQDGYPEIITGGTASNNTFLAAELRIWNYTSGSVNLIATRMWNVSNNDTAIYRVLVADVDNDTFPEILTLGTTGTQAQFCVFNYTAGVITLRGGGCNNWNIAAPAEGYDIAVGDLYNNGKIQIVTTGITNDGTRLNAFLRIFNFSSNTLTLINSTAWYREGLTESFSVAIDDVDNDTKQEIINSGNWFDGTRDNTDVEVWNLTGPTLLRQANLSWYISGHSSALTVLTKELDFDNMTEITTVGFQNDATYDRSQVNVLSYNSTTNQLFRKEYQEITTEAASIRNGDFGRGGAIADINEDDYYELVSAGRYGMSPPSATWLSMYEFLNGSQVPQYGWLNVSYQSPATGNSQSVNQYDTFNVSMNVTCVGGTIGCGTVNGTLRYNASAGLNPDTKVSAVIGDTPLFVSSGGNFRPTSYESNGTNPTFAYDGGFNDTSTVAQITYAGWNFSINYTYTNLGSTAKLFYTITLFAGSGNLDGVFVWNWSSNGWYHLWNSNKNVLTTLSNDTSMASGLIASNGTMKVRFNVSMGAPGGYMNISDTYVSSGVSNPSSCGSLTQGQTCTLSWTVNATGTPNNQYFLDTNFTSNTVASNDSGNFQINITNPYGWLNVSYQSPISGNSQNVNQYDTFNVSMNVTCVGGSCGSVTGVLRYNNSAGLNPNTNVSAVNGTTPFYVKYASQPYQNFIETNISDGPTRVYSVVIGDANRDGQNELVVGIESGTNELRMYENKTGTWVETNINDEPVTANSVAIGDANNDGKNDVVIGMWSTNNETRMYENKSGGWVETNISDVSDPIYSLKIGDANNDGQQEVVIGLGPMTTGQNGTRMYENKSGGWVETNISDPKYTINSLAIGDANNDLKNDVVIGGTFANETRMYENKSGTWVETNISDLPGNVNSVAIGDANNDGQNEVVIGGTFANGIRMYENKSGGWIETNVSGTSSLSVAIGDVNNDGKNEVVIGMSSTTNELRMYENKSGGWVETNISDVPASVDSIAIGDVNNDGQKEGVIGMYSTTNEVRMYKLSSNSLSCGSLTQGQTCTLSWTVNATGTSNTQYFLDANFTSTVSPANDSGDFQINITAPPAGWLNVSYQSPATSNSQNVNQYSTFNVSMNVTCVGGGSCGFVNGTLRYNNSGGLNPDMNISVSDTATPFYIKAWYQMIRPSSYVGNSFDPTYAYDNLYNDTTTYADLYNSTQENYSLIGLGNTANLFYTWKENARSAGAVGVVQIMNWTSGAFYVLNNTSGSPMTTVTVFASKDSGWISTGGEIKLNFVSVGGTGPTYGNLTLYDIYADSVTSTNPSSCGSLTQGQTCQLNWTVNATGSGQYFLDANFTSSLSQVPANDSGNFQVNITVPAAGLSNVSIGNVSNIYRGETLTNVFCNVTSVVGDTAANVSLQYSNAGAWLDLNESNYNGRVSYVNTYGSNPRWGTTVTTTGTIVKFAVFANWTGSPQFRCNVTQGSISSPIKGNLSSAPTISINAPPLNTTMSSTPASLINISAGESSNFNLTCNLKSLIGNASSVSLSVQWNSTPNDWHNITSVDWLNANESTPINYTNIDNSSVNTRVFRINGSVATNYSVRCYAISSANDGSYENYTVPVEVRVNLTNSSFYTVLYESYSDIDSGTALYGIINPGTTSLTLNESIVNFYEIGNTTLNLTHQIFVGNVSNSSYQNDSGDWLPDTFTSYLPLNTTTLAPRQNVTILIMSSWVPDIHPSREWIAFFNYSSVVYSKTEWALWSSEELFYDEFTTNTNWYGNWGVTPGNWNVSTTIRYNGTSSAMVNNGGGVWKSIAHNQATSGYGYINVSFWTNTTQNDGGEGINFSYWNGTNWKLVYYQQGNAGWNYSSFILPSDADDNPNLRVNVSCYNNQAAEYCYVDTFRITGVPIRMNVTIGNVTDTYRGDTDNDIFCNVSTTGGSYKANITLQYNNGTTGGWIYLNETNKATNVSYINTYGTNPRWDQTVGTSGTIFRFAVYGNWTGSGNQFRCNSSRGSLTSPSQSNISSTSAMTILTPLLNTSMATVPAAPITLYNDQSNDLNLTCNVTTLIGNASSVTVSGQWNSSAGVWNPLNTTDGPMRSNETAVIFSGVDNSSWASENRTFRITGYTNGNYAVRCYSNSSDRDGANSNGSAIAAVSVTAPPAYRVSNVSIGNVSNVTRGATETDLFCNVTLSGSGTGATGFLSLQYYNGTAWNDLNTTTPYTKNITYDSTYGGNPRNFSAITASTAYRFAVFGNWTGNNYLLRCNITDQTNLAYNISLNGTLNVTAVPLNSNATTDLTPPITLYNDQSNNFNLTCNVSAYDGNATSVTVFAQWNTSSSTTWNNFSKSGSLQANDTNFTFSNVDTVTPDTLVYRINATAIGSYWVRCFNNASKQDGSTTNNSNAIAVNVISAASLNNVSIGNVSNIYRGDKDDVLFCNATSSGGSVQANVTLQFQNATGWYTLNESFNGGKVAYVADYGTNPRWNFLVTTAGNSTRFSVFGNWTGSQVLRCNVTQGTLGSSIVNTSSTATLTIDAPLLNTSITTVPSGPITIYTDESNNFNLTCNVSALIGNASSVTLYAQWNSSAGVWNNFTNTGSLKANETSPLNFSNVDNATPKTRVFMINSSTIGSYSVRCYANSSAQDGANVNWTGIVAVTVTGPPDTTAPNIANFKYNVTNATNYSSIQGYQFNATVIDAGVGVDDVWIEHNFTGTMQNVTVTTLQGSEYYYNYQPLAAGFYYVKWWANDTNNQVNSTDFVKYYQVNKSYLSLTLYINGTDGDRTLFNNSNANFTSNFSSGNAFTIEIWSNLTGSWALEGSGASPYELTKTLNQYQARAYLVIANFSNDNYTYSQANHTLTLSNYGWLNVSYQSPMNGSSQNVIQDNTFNVSVNVTCVGGSCGSVSGVLRYNTSAGLNPDTNISTIIGATPFYALTNVLETNISNPGNIVNSVAIGDANNDGQRDVVIGMNQNTNETRIYENKTGGWIETNISHTPSSVQSVAIGDANNDGKNDVAVAIFGASGGNLTRIYENKSGAWIETNISYVPQSVNSIAIGDANNDGKNDVVIGMGSTSNDFRMYTNTSGTWVETNISDPGNVIYSIVIGDANNDGKNEVVIGLYSTNNETRMYTNTSGTWVETNIGDVDNTVYSVAIGDANRDGQNEVVIGKINSTPNQYNVRMYKNQSGAWAETNISDPPNIVRSVAIGDANKDGQNEVVIGLYSTNNEVRMYANKTGTWVETNISDEPVNVYSVAIGDANNDGKNDVVIGMGTSKNETRMYGITSNPSSCGTMSQSQICSLSWTVNATGTPGTQYFLDANFTSSYSAVSANDSGNFQINITSGAIAVNPSSPTNGTIVDRDSVNASVADYLRLVVNTNALSIVNITFKANLTSPSIGGQTNLTIGYNITNSSGQAVFNWDPNISYYAGNYTWWAEANVSYAINGTMALLVYGGFNLTFQSQTSSPDSGYVLGQNVTINATLRSLGPESVLGLNTSYLARVNSTIIAEDSTTRLAYLNYSTTIFGNWTGNYTLASGDPLSGNPYYVSLNASANYFFTNTTNFSRSFNVLTNVTISITLYNAPINYSNVDPGLTVNASVQFGFPMIVSVDSGTNVNVDIFVKSSNTSMTGPSSNYIMVQNQTFANNSQGQFNKTLNTSFQMLQNNISAPLSGLGKNVSSYWWLAVPNYIVPGVYSNTIVVNANQSV
jgi:hypothetical protein